MFEENHYTFYGVPILENEVLSESIVFELAYDTLNCKDIEQLRVIYRFFNDYMKNDFIQDLSSVLNISISIIQYDGLGNLFNEKNSKI